MICCCVCGQSLQSCLTLHNPMDCSLPGSSVLGIFQTRILEWVAIPFSRGTSQPEDQTHASCTAGRFFTIGPPGKQTAQTNWGRSAGASLADSAGTLKGIYIVTLPSPGVVENLSFKTVSSLSHPSFLLQSILPLFPFAIVSTFCARSSHYTACSQQYPCLASLCCPPQFTNSCYCKWQPSSTMKLASALPAFNNHFISKCTTHHFCNSFATRYMLVFFFF